MHITFYICRERESVFFYITHVYCVAGWFFFPKHSSQKKREDLDEFVAGCMQLHGPAKSLQRLGLVLMLGGHTPTKKGNYRAILIMGI